MEQIIIEGGIARHVRVETLHQTQLANLAPFLITRLATTLPVLPQRPTRYVSFDPQAGTGIIVVETAPRRNIMQVQHHGTDHHLDATRRSADGLSRYNVMLPYQYFTYAFRMNISSTGALMDFTINGSYLFWARDPIRTPDAPLWTSHCPNVDNYGNICWGGTQSDASSLSARIDDLVNNFYTTTFNQDLGHRTPFGTSLLNWETDSENPLAYRDWSLWDEPSFPLSEINTHITDSPDTIMAELNPAHIDIPALPQNFSVARAREWLNSLSDGAQRRIAAAIATTDITEEAEA